MQENQASRLKISDRTNNSSFSPETFVSDSNQVSKSKRFKQFLMANTSQNSNQNRPHTADRFDRSSQFHSSKKSPFYRKLLTKSIDHYQKSQNITFFKRPIQNAKKGEDSGIIFREFFSQNQKNSFSNRIDNNLKRKNVNFDIKKIDCKEQIKSFESFLDLKKKQFKKQIRNSVTFSNTIDVEGQKTTIEDAKLTIQGNHKQLKPKQIANTAKKAKKLREQAKKSVMNTTKSSPNPELKLSHQSQSKKSISHQKVKKCQQLSQKRQSSLDETNKLKNLSCFKNLYSPFNGIQIKYQSLQDQDLFPNQIILNTKKMVIKSFPRPSSRVNKFNYFPKNVTKGIVFRQKSNVKENDQNRIDGWKVKPEINYEVQDDLCYKL